MTTNDCQLVNQMDKVIDENDSQRFVCAVFLFAHALTVSLAAFYCAVLYFSSFNRFST